ncbi:MAG: dienelactone hydrolase family protein [Actinobacteria bacterium]|nr:dienelactone hydrolase family protein [Actinomycetota bacterium]MBV9933726.1 dienelactone hydrolase family protein [Actinomycetota bacterium]
MDFIAEPLVGKGVVERRFDLKVEDRLVPGIVWTPEDAEGTRPLVLIGHGGSLHKRTEYVLALARRLVRRNGIAAAAIDGPMHGDRGDTKDLSNVAEWWNASTTDDMVADWKATLAAVQALPEVGKGRLGYWGLSMGTIFGLPFVASEPQVQVAVLGLMGAFGATADRLAADAAKITCPVLFLQQLEDELIPRPAVAELFDALGTRDKRLHANPGAHSAVPPEEFNVSQEFLASHLLPPS